MFIYLSCFYFVTPDGWEHGPDVAKMINFLIWFKIGPIKVILFCHDEIWFCCAKFLFEAPHTCTCAYFGLKCGHSGKCWIDFRNWIHKMMTCNLWRWIWELSNSGMMSLGDITFQVGDILLDPTHIFQMTTDLNVINMCPIA